MQKIVLDTNALLMPVERKLDVFEECRRLTDGACTFAIMSNTLEELKMLGSRRTKEGTAARIALQMLEKNKTEIIPAQRTKVDNATLALAKSDNDIAFATNDSVLRRKIRDAGARVICLKGEGKLGWC